MAQLFTTKAGKKVNIEWKQNIEKDKRNVFFYGGSLMTAWWKNPETDIVGYISMTANGDVIGSLYTADWSDELARFKDKSNEGYRGDVERWINTDAELDRALGLKGDDRNDYVLSLDDNNWIEYFFDRRDKNTDSTIEYDCYESVIDDDDKIPTAEGLSDRLDEWFDEITKRETA